MNKRNKRNNFRRMNKNNKNIGGYKHVHKIAPFYIGKLDKKKRSLGFVDPITDEEITKIKREVDLSYFTKKEEYNVQNIKGLNESVHISEARMGTANDGDIVLIQIVRGENLLKSEGIIKYILKRQRNTLVGVFQASKEFGFVVPDDKTFISDIFIPKKEVFGAKDGDKVLVEVTKFVNDRKSNSEGKIIKIVARKGENYMELKSLLAENGIEEEFSPEVMFESENTATEVHEDEIKNRVDLRNIRTYTIDGEDAKDLDDAVSIEKKQNYIVHVSIADVSHYVKENSFMDKEAVKRGNSIYLIDTVIPMLPTALSNDICSLNAGVDRLAMTVKAEIDNQGNILDYDIFKSVVKVDRRMSYKEVQNIIDGNVEDEDKNDFKLFEKLANILIKRRTKNGYINFDIPEIEVELDEKGKAIGVDYKTRYFANKIIEHLMLTANEIVAEEYNKLEVPVIYRVHETPDPDRVLEINEQLEEYGVKINVQKEEGKNGKKDDGRFIPQKEYIRVLNEIEKKKKEQEEGIDLSKDSSEYIDYSHVSYLLLRSMRKAKYLEKNLGHYGIGSEYYLHFTSPIRRYSDLYTHRMISKYLKNKNYFKENNLYNEYESKAKIISEVISETERLAIDLERQYDDIKISEYVSNFVGETFDGVVVSKTNFGMFVNIGKEIEGLVRKEGLPEGMVITDYKVGQKVKVLVYEVNQELGQIDLKLVTK